MRKYLSGQLDRAALRSCYISPVTTSDPLTLEDGVTLALEIVQKLYVAEKRLGAMRASVPKINSDECILVESAESIVDDLFFA